MRIFSVLLWILFPGCWAVTGPGAVRGPPGGSVAVRCRYQSRYEDYPKFWCRAGGGWRCSNRLHVVETDGSEAEVTRGRVSIRDNHPQREFTVTVGNLTPADAGTHLCGVGRWRWRWAHAHDLSYPVELTVSPVVPSPLPTARTPQATKQPDSPPPTKDESSFSPPAHITPARFQPIICFLLLILLKVLLVLCIVGAVIWMSVRYRKSHGEMVPDKGWSKPPDL